MENLFELITKDHFAYITLKHAIQFPNTIKIQNIDSIHTLHDTFDFPYFHYKLMA